MMFRQGDVLIRRVDKLPDNLNPVKPEAKGLVLAHGEATGHAHAVPVEGGKLYASNQNDYLYLTVENDTAVRHEEHKSIPLTKETIYEVRRQKEFDYWSDESRYVAD